MSIRSRIRAWRRRRRRTKAATKGGNDLREFVYLDEVSVYSLIASRLGPIATEFTESETSSLASEVSSSVGAKAGPLSAGVGSRISSTDSRGTQVLRKSIVQTTFKELHDLEAERLLMQPRPSESVPRLSNAPITLQSLKQEGPPWVVSPADLVRGALIELEVELEVEPIYANSAVVATMVELARDSPEILNVIGAETFGSVQSLGQIFERLLAGLVPIRATAVDYEVAMVEGHEVLVHRELAQQLHSVDGITLVPLVLVGVAEEALFWKDVRRVLFSHSRFRVFGRVSRPGIHESWTPVKLENVLRQVPSMSQSFEIFNNPALMAGESSAADETGLEQLSTALVLYAADTAASLGKELPADFQPAIDVEVTSSDGRLGVTERRQVFANVTKQLEEIFEQPIPSTDAAIRRTVAWMDAQTPSGATQGIEAGDKQASAAMAEAARFVDVELVAVYW